MKISNKIKHTPKILLLLLGLLVLVLSLGWLAKEPNVKISDSNKNDTLQHDSDTQNNTGCSEKGIIIVTFQPDITEAIKLRIIRAEGVTIRQEFPSFNGYSLNVPVNQEQQMIDAFKWYSEIISANLNNCDINQIPQ